MPINLAAIAQAGTSATALSNLILVSPQQTVGYQPQNAPSWKNDTSPQPKALIFNYEGEQTVSLSSDITDHYIENNTAVQDQIAIRPIVITTEGFVGELNDIAPAALKPLQIAAEKLTTVSAFVPSISTTALIAYNLAFEAYQVGLNLVNNAVSTWASINGQGGESVINGSGISSQPNQTQQQVYFQQFFAYQQQRTLFTIQTPWAIFQDMAIMNLTGVQDSETRMISSFKITFKMLRFASTTLVDSQYSDNNEFQGRAYNQGSPEVNLGTNSLDPSPTTFASTLA